MHAFMGQKMYLQWFNLLPFQEDSAMQLHMFINSYIDTVLEVSMGFRSPKVLI